MTPCERRSCPAAWPCRCPGPGLTVAARQALPEQIPHAAAAANSARAALLIAALTGRPDLLLAGTQDFLHQSYRAAAMPDTASLIARLREAGIAAVVSGAGPAILSLTVAGEQAGTPRVAQIAAHAARPGQGLPLAGGAAGGPRGRRGAAGPAAPPPPAN